MLSILSASALNLLSPEKTLQSTIHKAGITKIDNPSPIHMNCLGQSVHSGALELLSDEAIDECDLGNITLMLPDFGQYFGQGQLELEIVLFEILLPGSH